MPKVHFVSRKFLKRQGVKNPPRTVEQIETHLRRNPDHFRFPSERQNEDVNPTSVVGVARSSPDGDNDSSLERGDPSDGNVADAAEKTATVANGGGKADMPSPETAATSVLVFATAPSRKRDIRISDNDSIGVYSVGTASTGADDSEKDAPGDAPSEATAKTTAINASEKERHIAISVRHDEASKPESPSAEVQRSILGGNGSISDETPPKTETKWPTPPRPPARTEKGRASPGKRSLCVEEIVNESAANVLQADSENLPEDETLPLLSPHAHDVLSGHGSWALHPGNIRFYQELDLHREECIDPSAWQRIAENVLASMKALDPPGRFLKKNLDTWMEISDTEAKAKIWQALYHALQWPADAGESAESAVAETMQGGLASSSDQYHHPGWCGCCHAMPYPPQYYPLPPPPAVGYFLPPPPFAYFCPPPPPPYYSTTDSSQSQMPHANNAIELQERRRTPQEEPQESPKKQTAPTSITTLHPHDVLGGSRSVWLDHPGNTRYRQVVESHIQEYRDPNVRSARTAEKIVASIRGLDPPGRFFKQIPGTDFWAEIGDKEAMEKTRQALGAASRRIRKAAS